MTIQLTTKYLWKFFLTPIIVCSLFLFSCAPSNRSSLPGKTTSTIDVNNLLEQQSTQEISDSPAVVLLGEQLTINNYSLEIPIDWYYLEVNQTNMNGWVFTSQDPQITQEHGFNGWAGALWVVTPLPSGASPEEFRDNLQNQAYQSSDLEAMLIVPEQAGLLDLSDAETLLTAVQITAWGNQPSLKMEGTITFSATPDLMLDTIVYLMVHDRDFLTYYQFSDQAITEQVAPVLTASLESLGYSQ